jgi:hypothetical protein
MKTKLYEIEYISHSSMNVILFLCMLSKKLIKRTIIVCSQVNQRNY